jgi:hypothetical protein
MHGPRKKKLGREVKIEEGWMLQKRSVLIGAPRGFYRVCQLPGGSKSVSFGAATECMVSAKRNLVGWSRYKKAGCCKREVTSYGPLVVSKGCANFLEDVKVHLVMKSLNTRSQQNETWQAGKNKRKLDAENEKDPHMGPSGFLQSVPTSWRM